MRTALRLALAAAVAGSAWAARDRFWRQREEGLSGQIAVVTGGRNGLSTLLGRR